MSTPDPAPLDRLGLLAGMQGEFLATIPEVDPRTPVPWCGRWRVRDLVVHVARIHHWAAAQARGGPTSPLGRGPFDLAALYRDCAAELRDTLSALGPDAVGATLLGRGPVTFWHRRQLHETLVHLWDLRTAGGRPADADSLVWADTVWADTVDEVVTVLQPRQVRLGRMARLPLPVGLAATDVDRRWRLDCAVPPDVPPNAPDDVRPAVEVRGPASSLALLLWRRTSADDPALAVTGDRAVLDDALTRPLTP